MVTHRDRERRVSRIEFTGTGMNRARTMALLIALGGLLMASSVLAQEVYRWKDEEGKVHYSKTLPPHAASIPYDILSSRGILLERVTHEKPEPDETGKVAKKGPAPLAPLYSEEERRRMANNLLLLRYSSEDEIIQAMNHEIDQGQYDKRLLETDSTSVQKSMVGEIHMAANRLRAGKEVPEDQLLRLKELRQRLATNAEARGRLNQRDEEIRGKYEAEILRFRELIESPEEDTGP